MTENVTFFDGKPGSRRRAMERRRRAILGSAMGVFSQKGYFQADVGEIANIANVSKGSIYNHFANKKDLFIKTLEWGIEMMSETIDEQVKIINNPYERFVKMMKFYFEFFDTNVEFFRVLILEREIFEHSSYDKTLKLLISKRLHILEELIEKCIKEDVFIEIPPHKCAVMIFGASNGLIFDWITNKRAGKISDMIDTLESTIIRGLLKQKGECFEN